MTSIDKSILIRKTNEIENDLWHFKCGIDFDETARELNEVMDKLVQDAKDVLDKIKSLRQDTRTVNLKYELNN